MVGHLYEKSIVEEYFRTWGVLVGVSAKTHQEKFHSMNNSLGCVCTIEN